MKVILLTDVAKLGKRFDVKDVSSGHATNFLIPSKFAIAATAEALKSLDVQKKKAEGEKKVQEELLIKNLAELDGKTLTIKEKANKKGHLFAGLHREEIAKQIAKLTRIEIDPSNIMLDQPIKDLGEHTIEVKTEGKSAKFTLVIES